MATKRYKYTTVRKWEGDDSHSWSVFRKGIMKPVYSGLTRSELDYYRDRLEKEEEKRRLTPEQRAALELGLDPYTDPRIVGDFREEKGLPRDYIKLKKVSSIFELYRLAKDDKYYRYWLRWVVSNMGGPGSDHRTPAHLGELWSWIKSACMEWEFQGEDGEDCFLQEALHCREICEEEINTGKPQFHMD